LWCRKLGIAYDIINDGDDIVVFMERESEVLFREGLEQHYLYFGFRIVAEPTSHRLEEIEFCQMRPVCVNGSYRMVRNPLVCIEKDTFCVKTLNHNDSFEEWASGVAVGGRIACDGVPVLRAFYEYLDYGVECRKHLAEESGMFRMSTGMRDWHREVDDTSRWSFYLAFGIDPHAQIVLEEWFTTHSWEPDVLSNQVCALPGANFATQQHPTIHPWHANLEVQHALLETE
jgi:hypothetical protein